MPSITDLNYTDSMSSSKIPALTDLRESLDSIETYVNDSIKDNLLQITKDAYPSAYAFDSDGSGQYTYNLYDKLTGVSTYTGGDFTIATTGAWTDVDASNAKIAFTPELAGDFKVTAMFSVSCVTSNSTNEVDVRFRLTDSTTNSDALPRVKLVTGVTSTTNVVPVSLSYTFLNESAAVKTVKLQYFITTLTNTTVKVLANSNDPLVAEVEKV